MKQLSPNQTSRAFEQKQAHRKVVYSSRKDVCGWADSGPVQDPVQLRCTMRGQVDRHLQAIDDLLARLHEGFLILARQGFLIETKR
jgi:hypothetical protein